MRNVPGYWSALTRGGRPPEQGIQFGRKPHEGSAKALKMIRKGATTKEMREATGMSRATYFRLKKAI